MITESTPYGIGTTNEKSWEEWFVPFFEFIKQNPVIKGVCYIDWDWRDYPQWTNWGDGRLESNPGLTKKYLDEISDPIWLHAQEKGKMVQYLSGYVKID
jgi:hypothetical protein